MTATMTDTQGLQERIATTVEGIFRAGNFNSIGRKEEMNMAVSHEEAGLLRDLVVKCGAKNTLEVGMGTGLSGSHICWGLLKNGGGQHTAIDPYQQGPDWNGLGLALRDHLGLQGMFDWVCERSDQALPAMVREGRQFDFAFIDGNHRFEGALVDFYYVDQLISVGGVVLFDDADWPSVRRAVNFARRHRNYEQIGGSKIDLGPLTRVWGWKMRAARRKRFEKTGWPAEEANRPQPYETVALRKTAEDDRGWKFWASLE